MAMTLALLIGLLLLKTSWLQWEEKREYHSRLDINNRNAADMPKPDIVCVEKEEQGAKEKSSVISKSIAEKHYTFGAELSQKNEIPASRSGAHSLPKSNKNNIYIVQKSARIQDPFKNTKSSSNKAKAGCDSSSLSAKSPLQHPRRNMVLFDSETVRWLNHVVEKIWPVCMEPIVSQKILLPSIPWFLEKYKPWTVHLYMGRSPPVFTEMRVLHQTTDDDHLVLGLGMNFRTADDMSAILAVKLSKRLGFGMRAKLHLMGMHVEGKEDGAKVMSVENLNNPYKNQRNFDRRFKLTLNKLYAWKLVDYDRVVMLDSDNLFLQKTDELFKCEPSMKVFNDMLHELDIGRNNPDGADQGFIGSYFPDLLDQPMFHPPLNGYQACWNIQTSFGISNGCLLLLMETAINIAYACKLIDNDMKQFIISSETDEIREVESRVVDSLSSHPTIRPMSHPKRSSTFC
ncbi:unnamed protein product [Camellia sinensis]